MRRVLLSEWSCVLLITAIAAALRLVALDRLPPGLYRDEAFNGLDALDVLAGHWPVFFEANNGREPFFIYLCALSIRLWGRSPGALRLASAAVGVLTVPATYWLGRELFDRRVAGYAAFLAATLVWLLNLGRVALRVGSMPLVLALALAMLWRGWRGRRLLTTACAGALYGLSAYTYLAARFTPLALGLFGMYAWLARRRRTTGSPWWRGTLAFAGAALLVFAPLGGYWATHWSATLARSTQVSVLNPAVNGGNLWGTLAQNVWRSMSGLVLRGDTIPRHNVPGRPIFDGFLALVTGVGLVVLFCRAKREPSSGLVLIWVGVMLLPTVLAEDAPHMLRGSGVLPLLLMVPAVGLNALATQAEARWKGPTASGAVWCALVISGALGAKAYVAHLSGPTAYYSFEAGATQLAADINSYLESGWDGSGLGTRTAPARVGRHVYVAKRLWQDWSSVRYLCPSSEGLQVLPVETRAPVTGDVLLALWPFEDNRRALALLPARSLIKVEEGAWERGDLERESRLLYITVRAGEPVALPENADVTWQGGIRLRGYAWRPLSGQRSEVTLYWEASRPIEVSYTVFVHAISEGRLIGQHDGPVAGGYYGTERWRAGDIVEDRHILPLSAPSPTERSHLEVGLYRWPSLEHLQVIDPSGQVTGETSSILR